MKLITSVKIQKADHTQVIDTAATQVGSAAHKAFLFVINHEIQGWRNFTALCSWGFSRVGEKHGAIFAEVRGSAVAVFHKGCQQETAFVQELIQSQLTDRMDAHWKLHDQAIAWFYSQTQAFLVDNPAEESSEVVTEEQAPGVAEDLEQAVPVVEAEPSITAEDEAPIPILDPDPLDDELSVPTDPTPVTTGSKRRTGGKRMTLADVVKQEVAKSK